MPTDLISGYSILLKWNSGVMGALRTVLAAGTIARVRLGDGMAWARAGERVRYKNNRNDLSPRNLRWGKWPERVLAGGLFDNREHSSRPPEFLSSMPHGSEGGPVNGGRDCFFVANRVEHPSVHLAAHDYIPENPSVEQRHIDLSSAVDMPDWRESVAVLEEGLALPTRVLLDLVNTVHAVLVLRGITYYYLHNDFALSAEEEASLVEWGIGRRAFAGILLAVGGLMLVLKAGVWRPAVIGNLLVTAAAYRVEGTLTTLLRVVRSREWKNGCQLIPAGIHGTERFVQFVLITTLAVSELLDSRVLLIVGLSLATAQVALLEVIGQMVTTWGYKRGTWPLY